MYPYVVFRFNQFIFTAGVLASGRLFYLASAIVRRPCPAKLFSARNLPAGPESACLSGISLHIRNLPVRPKTACHPKFACHPKAPPSSFRFFPIIAALPYPLLTFALKPGRTWRFRDHAVLARAFVFTAAPASGYCQAACGPVASIFPQGAFPNDGKPGQHR